MSSYTTQNGGTFQLQKALSGRAKVKRRSRWVGWLLAATVLGALLFPTTAKGERDVSGFDLLAPDKAAHMGVSYAIYTFNYGFYHKAFQMPKLQSHIFAAANTLFVGLVWEMMGNMDANDMLANGLGCTGAFITIDAFDF